MNKEARLGGKLRRLRQERKLSQATMAADGEVQAALPSEEVSDFIQQRRNHFKELESAAETLWREHDLDIGNLPRQLVDILAQRFAVEVVIRPAGQMDATLREY